MLLEYCVSCEQSDMAHRNRTKSGFLQIGNRKIFVYEGTNTVGRNKEAVVILKDIIGSQQHAIISIINDCHYISDLKSTNGTKLNNIKLVPFQIYPLEDGHILEFTPAYVGSYKKLAVDASQSTIANDSQMTPVEDGFFCATTQLQTTRIIANQTNADLSRIQEVEEREHGNPVVEEIVCINDMETQVVQVEEPPLNITVPTINEVATQIIEVQSALTALVDSQQFSTQANEIDRDVLLNETNPNLNRSTVQSSSGETSQSLTSDIPTVPVTSCSLSNEGIIQAQHAEFGDTLVVTSVNPQENLEIGTGSEDKTDIGDSNDFDDQSLMEVADKVMNKSLQKLEESQPSSQQCRPSNSSHNGKVSIADLSTQTVHSDTQLTEERFVPVDRSSLVSLNLQLSETIEANAESNESPDIFGTDENVLQKQATTSNSENKSKENAGVISDSDDSENFLVNKSSVEKNLVRRSRFVLSDSEDEDNEKQPLKSIEKSTSKIVNDSLSDYDDSFVQRKSIGNGSLIPATQDGSFACPDGSFKLGLSHIQEITELGDISSLQNSSRIESSVVEERQKSPETTRDEEETQIIDFDLENIKESNAVSADNLAPAQTLVISSKVLVEAVETSTTQLNVSENDTMSADFLAPTQKLDVSGQNSAEEMKNASNHLHNTENDEMGDDFLAPTQNLNIPDGTHGTNDVDDDFLAPTQVIEKSSTNLGKLQDMFDFEAATQQIAVETPTEVVQNGKNDVNEDVDFLAPTQQLPNESDNDLFCAPTQSVSCFLKAKRELRKSNRSSNTVDYDAPRQKLSSDKEKEVFIADTQVLDVDCIETATQPIKVITTPKEKKRVSSVDSKFASKEKNLSVIEGTDKPLNESKKKEAEPDADFKAPTQVVKPLINIDMEDAFDAPTQECLQNDDREKTAYTEAETQDIAKLIAAPCVTKPPEIESQLEVMFESQNLSLSAVDTSRPLNPMANTLETSSTQDVLESLTGAKRLSDDFGDDRSAKRMKTTSELETNDKPAAKGRSTRKNKSDTKLTPRVSRKSTRKVCTEVNNNPSTSKGSSIVGYVQLPAFATDTDLCKPSLKLSLKKKSGDVNCKDSSSPEDEYNDGVQCFADLISMKSLDVPDIIGDPPGNENKDETTTPKVDATLDSTVARKNKRRLMDEETMCAMLSPVVKLVRMSDSQDEMTSCPEDVNKAVKSVGDVKAKTRKETSGRAKKERVKKSDTAEVKKNTRGRKAKVENSNSDEEPEIKKKSSRKGERPTARASARQRKIVDYNENSGSSNISCKTTDKPDENSEDDNDLVISVPENLVMLTSIDGNSLQQVQAKPKVEVVKSVVRRGRPAKAKLIKEEPAFVTSTPDRNKRVVKPKVAFTMLDDPHLRQIIRGLGGSVVEDLETSNVLVTTKVQRTLKLLSAIANSMPICGPNWLHECKKANTFLDPWDYLIKDQEAEKQWKFSIGDTLQKSKRGKVFAGHQFLLLISLSVDIIKGAIETNGGKVVLRKPTRGNFTVVSAPSKRDKYEPFLKSKVNVVTTEFVLVGILRQELCFDEFKLT